MISLMTNGKADSRSRLLILRAFPAEAKAEDNWTDIAASAVRGKVKCFFSWQIEKQRVCNEEESKRGQSQKKATSHFLQPISRAFEDHSIEKSMN